MKINYNTSRLLQLRMRVIMSLAFIPVLDYKTKPKKIVKEYERLQKRIEQLDYPRFVNVVTTRADGATSSEKLSAAEFLRMESNLMAESVRFRTKKFVGTFSMLSHAEMSDGSKIDVILDR